MKGMGTYFCVGERYVAYGSYTKSVW